jgi:hypothetical protein
MHVNRQTGLDNKERKERKKERKKEERKVIIIRKICGECQF